MTALNELLQSFRDAAVTEREKGSYFEELIATYLRNEATYRDLYSEVWPYAESAKLQGIDARTAVIQDGRLHVQAGAGIVYDSDPQKEWEETMNKGRALFRAVAQAAGGL